MRSSRKWITCYRKESDAYIPLWRCELLLLEIFGWLGICQRPQAKLQNQSYWNSIDFFIVSFYLTIIIKRDHDLVDRKSCGA